VLLLPGRSGPRQHRRWEEPDTPVAPPGFTATVAAPPLLPDGRGA